jgi:hypothetical protein
LDAEDKSLLGGNDSIRDPVQRAPIDRNDL